MVDAIPNHLTAAYQATAYRVWFPEGVEDLRVGEGNERLQDYLQRGKCRGWLVITGHNPASRQLSEAENHLRQRELVGLLQVLGLSSLPALNIPDTADWPAEPSLFVAAPVVDRELAKALGARLGQYAVLYGEPGGLPEMLWCGEARPK